MADRPKTTDSVVIARNPMRVLEQRIATLFDALAHGSQEHRAWLRQAIDDHFNGRPVEPPRG